MVNEIKKSKVETLVVKINKKHDEGTGTSIYPNELLRLVFNFQDLNDYGKIIVKNAKFATANTSDFNSNLSSDKPFEKSEKRKILIREWVNYCCNNDRYGTMEAFYFVLLALLVVTVDKTDKEEKLSIICDFARMLMITDDEIKDMVEMIKVILGKDDYNILLKSHSGVIDENELQRLRNKQEEFVKCIKSERTFRFFSNLIKAYTGIDGHEIVRERQAKGIATSFYK